MNAKLQIYDRIEIIPLTGQPLQATVTRVERRAIGWNYFAKGTEPGRRSEYRICQGLDDKWYEFSAH